MLSGTWVASGSLFAWSPFGIDPNQVNVQLAGQCSAHYWSSLFRVLVGLALQLRDILIAFQRAGSTQKAPPTRNHHFTGLLQFVPHFCQLFEWKHNYCNSKGMDRVYFEVATVEAVDDWIDHRVGNGKPLARQRSGHIQLDEQRRLESAALVAQPHDLCKGKWVSRRTHPMHRQRTMLNVCMGIQHTANVITRSTNILII